MELMQLPSGRFGLIHFDGAAKRVEPRLMIYPDKHRNALLVYPVMSQGELVVHEDRIQEIMRDRPFPVYLDVNIVDTVRFHDAIKAARSFQ